MTILSVISKKEQSVFSNASCYQHRTLTCTPWSRKNWREIRVKIHTYFSEIEDDFVLLHKPM